MGRTIGVAGIGEEGIDERDQPFSIVELSFIPPTFSPFL